MARSLNKVQLIGNLTRDPEVRYTGKGTAVATFSIATNREWKDESGGKKEEVEFHRVVAWDKLAEIIEKYLKKGSKVFVEGRIQSRKWQTKEGEDRTTFEIVINDLMMLDSKGGSSSYEGPEDTTEYNVPEDYMSDNKSQETKKQDTKSKKEEVEVEESDDDIPF